MQKANIRERASPKAPANVCSTMCKTPKIYKKKSEYEKKHLV
jgi:hypothetical protein